MSDVTVVLVPRLNPNDEHAVLVRWHVESGAWVEKEQALATVETTKATYDVEAPRSGYAFFEQTPESLVAVGAPIVWISVRNERPNMGARAPEVQQGPSGAAPRFTRKALQSMAQHGLAEADFPGSGRIGIADVEKLAAERRGAAVPVATNADTDTNGNIGPLRQSPAKMLEIARLGATYEQAIPSAVAVSVSCSALDARLRRIGERAGPVSLLELAIHDAARVLRDFPELNGFYSDGRAAAYKDVHVGFAVNLGKSLRVPVVRDAATLSPSDVARAVRDLSLRYLRGELTAADVAEGTFTITDLSSHGVVTFTPVLNYRQSAILGLCAERPGTGYRELVLAFDHRMTDGMQAASFLGKLCERLTSDASD